MPISYAGPEPLAPARPSAGLGPSAMPVLQVAYLHMDAHALDLAPPQAVAADAVATRRHEVIILKRAEARHLHMIVRGVAQQQACLRPPFMSVLCALCCQCCLGWPIRCTR